MIKHLFQSSAIILSAVLISSCGSSTPPAPPIKVPVAKPDPLIASNAALAKRILAHPKISLLRQQVSGRVDGASSYHNIVSVSRGYSAKRSSYGNAPGGYTKLLNKMLKNMLYQANTKGYSYRITAIAGGSHSRNSRHYLGVAYDVDMINGRKVGYSNSHYRSFMSAGRAQGATEVLGPGDRGHNTHLHIAWPRP